MEREMNNFIKVWAVAIASACYSYSLSRIFHIPKGLPRLIFILPVVYLFTVLPYSLSFFHLSGPTIFYLVWLGNFKLILYCFDLGPLYTHPNKSILHFVAIALLPIKVKNESKSDVKNATQDGQKNQKSKRVIVGRSVLLCVKLLVLALVVKLYDYQQDLPSFVILTNYCIHVYLGVEVSLAATAALARATLGLELDPQFNEPYLTTSLQDFWGRRWNLMVPNILRLAAYSPVRCLASPWVGRRWGRVAGTLAAFTVSGLMHEIIYFYFTHVWPTWEVTLFFVLHGVCTSAEVAVKEAVGGRFRLHGLVSGPLTIGFVGVTGVWLFLPQILRNGVHVEVISGYPIMIEFVKQNVLYLIRH